MLTDEEKQRILDVKKKYSIYAIWSDKTLFKRIINEMSSPFENNGITKVVGLEARGFILGGAIAYKLNVGFVGCRKGGNMFNEYFSPDDVYKEEFVDYTRKTKSLEIERHAMSIQQDDKVLIVDDWFETGGQGLAAIRLIQRAGGQVVGISILLDQMTNKVRKSFDPYNIRTLVYFNDK